MGSIGRKLRKAEKDQVTEEQQRLPTGKIVSSPVKGEFTALPVLGWISLRKSTEIRLVMLAMLLFRDGKICGMFHVELPVYPETERDIISCLQRLGWDGRLWPRDAGWPDESNDEEGHRVLLESTQLAASMVFPPVGDGHATMNVHVTRARGPFFMSPLSKAEEDPDQKLVDRFHELCQDITGFYPKPDQKLPDGTTLH